MGCGLTGRGRGFAAGTGACESVLRSQVPSLLGPRFFLSALILPAPTAAPTATPTTIHHHWPAIVDSTTPSKIPKISPIISGSVPGLRPLDPSAIVPRYQCRRLLSADPALWAGAQNWPTESRQQGAGTLIANYAQGSGWQEQTR